MRVVVRMGDEVSSEVLVRVRQLSGLEIAVDGEGETWLRLDSCEEADLQSLRALPHRTIHELGNEDQLIPLGHRLPDGVLPKGLAWRSLKASIPLAFPLAAMPGQVPSSELAGFALEPDRGEVKEPNLLVTDLERVAHYVREVSHVRVSGLCFAVSGEGQVLIEGEPLPPISGMPYRLEEALALPLGKRLALPVGHAMAGRALKLESGEFAMLHGDGNFDRVHREDFVPMSRSAIRMTQERVSLGQASEEER